jgi:Double zinc ribbon/Phospholipase_D-nuclease N-terminal
MSSFSNRQASDASSERVNGDDGLKMIPLWSIFLAIAVSVGVLIYFNSVPQPAHRRPGTLPMHWIFLYTMVTALASYILLLGYVSRDVRRRNMPATLWLLIVLVMPGGIGAVVYFLLRQPIVMRCPNCTTELAATVHFCPQCQFQVAPVCGQCFRSVQITDVYCAQCGHEVAEDHAPARLRAYSDT